MHIWLMHARSSLQSLRAWHDSPRLPRVLGNHARGQLGFADADVVDAGVAGTAIRAPRAALAGQAARSTTSIAVPPSLSLLTEPGLTQRLSMHAAPSTQSCREAHDSPACCALRVVERRWFRFWCTPSPPSAARRPASKKAIYARVPPTFVLSRFRPSVRTAAAFRTCDVAPAAVGSGVAAQLGVAATLSNAATAGDAHAVRALAAVLRAAATVVGGPHVDALTRAARVLAARAERAASRPPGNRRNRPWCRSRRPARRIHRDRTTFGLQHWLAIREAAAQSVRALRRNRSSGRRRPP